MYKLDIHNMNIENNLRLYANPLSPSRSEKILEDVMKKEKVRQQVDDITTAYNLTHCKNVSGTGVLKWSPCYHFHKLVIEYGLWNNQPFQFTL